MTNEVSHALFQLFMTLLHLFNFLWIPQDREKFTIKANVFTVTNNYKKLLFSLKQATQATPHTAVSLRLRLDVICCLCSTGGSNRNRMINYMLITNCN